MPEPEPPTIQDDDEQALRAKLADLAVQRSQAVAAADAQIGETHAALATAGSEYEAPAESAAQDYQAAQSSYDDFLTQTSADLDGAQTALDSVNTDLVTADSVAPIAITVGGVPDCSAANIEAAVNGAIEQINTILQAILDQLNNGNPAAIKDSIQKLKDVGAAFHEKMPAAADNEAAKAAAHNTLEGMY